MMRRVELAWPVTDKLRQRIIDECLVAYLRDSRDAWGCNPTAASRMAGQCAQGHAGARRQR